MSYFDSIRFQFGTLPAEQKLRILRAESMCWLPTIQGYGRLLQYTVEQPDVSALTSEILPWCQALVQSAEMLRDLVDALTYPHHRTDRGMPELRLYANLLDAVKDTAHALALPLAPAIDDTTKVFVHSLYPLVLLDEPTYHREVSCSLETSQYVVQLLSWTSKQMFEVVLELRLMSLPAVAVVISSWLIEQRSLEDVRDKTC